MTNHLTNLSNCHPVVAAAVLPTGYWAVEDSQSAGGQIAAVAVAADRRMGYFRCEWPLTGPNLDLQS